MHQAQRFVVHQDDFHIQPVFRRRRHLLNVHHQATVAGEAQHFFIRVRQRRANCRRQAEAHGAQAAGGQPLTRTVQRIGLCSPHLMLAHVGGDNGVVVNARRRRVDQAVMAERVPGFRNRPRELLLQLGHFTAPRIARLRFNLRQQLCQNIIHIGLNRDVRLLDFPQLGAVDIDMNNFRVRAELSHFSGCPVIKTCT